MFGSCATCWARRVGGSAPESGRGRGRQRRRRLGRHGRRGVGRSWRRRVRRHPRRWRRVRAHGPLCEKQQRVASAHFLCLVRVPDVAQSSRAAGPRRVACRWCPAAGSRDSTGVACRWVVSPGRRQWPARCRPSQALAQAQSWGSPGRQVLAPVQASEARDRQAPSARGRRGQRRNDSGQRRRHAMVSAAVSLSILTDAPFPILCSAGATGCFYLTDKIVTSVIAVTKRLIEF